MRRVNHSRGRGSAALEVKFTDVRQRCSRSEVYWRKVNWTWRIWALKVNLPLSSQSHLKTVFFPLPSSSWGCEVSPTVTKKLLHSKIKLYVSYHPHFGEAAVLVFLITWLLSEDCSLPYLISTKETYSIV